jgi:hypothetical protein
MLELGRYVIKSAFVVSMLSLITSIIVYSVSLSSNDKIIRRISISMSISVALLLFFIFAYYLV